MARRTWRVIQIMEEAILAESEQEAIQIFLDQKDFIPPYTCISAEEIISNEPQRTQENGTPVS